MSLKSPEAALKEEAVARRGTPPTKTMPNEREPPETGVKFPSGCPENRDEKDTNLRS